jgi:hypothetical protein
VSFSPAHARFVLGLLVVGAASLTAGRARAHDPFEITTDAHISGDELRLHTTLSLLTAGRICLPERAKRPLLPPEFPSARAVLESCVRDFYQMTAAGAALVPRAVSLSLTVEHDLDVKVLYPRPTQGPLRFDAVYLRRLTHPSAGVVLTVTGERAFLGQQVLRPETPTLEVSLAPDAAALAGASAPRPAPSPSFRQFLVLGVEHILTGYDHLLFLLGLLVACRSLRAVLGVVTCFTVAHSLTLALAGLNIVSLPSRLVEPVIAATIVFIAVENLRQWHGRKCSDRDDTGDATTQPRGRILITFVFGLVHGFGFAMALREIGLGAQGAPILLPLLGFNLGVELGQIAVAAVVLPILWRLRSLKLFARYGAGVVSALIGIAGLIWFVQRLG